MIDIKDNTGKVLYSTPINKGSKRKFELMKEDFITLKFSLESPVDFPLGTYVECAFGRFEVVEDQSGTFNNSTGGYDYELKLEADYMKWRNKLFKYQPEVIGGNEASFSLTAPLWQHMDIFIRCLKSWGYRHNGFDYDYDIDDTVTTENIFLTYSNTNLIDALTMMAEATGCEWWMEDNYIKFGRMAVSGDPVTLKLGENAVSMTLSKSSGDYFTRIFAFGSTSNISPRYRKKLEFMSGSSNVFQELSGIWWSMQYDHPVIPPYFRTSVLEYDYWGKDIDGNFNVRLYDFDHVGIGHGAVSWKMGDAKAAGSSYKLAMDGLSIKVTGVCPYATHTFRFEVRSNPNTPSSLWSRTFTMHVESTFNPVTLDFTLDGDASIRFEEDGDAGIWLYIEVEIVPDVISGDFFHNDLSVVVSGNISGNSDYARAKTVIRSGDDSFEAYVNPRFLDYEEDEACEIAYSTDSLLHIPDGVKFTLSDIVRSRVPIGYFDSDVDGLTVNGVVQRRLMLPEGIPYVDVYDGMSEDEVIEGIVVFDYVFPGKVATVSSVSQRFIDQTEEYTDDNGETQERPTGIKLPVYTIKTADMAGFTQDCIIGDDLTVTFQTGSLAGLTFGAAFLPDESTDEEAAFEIVANEDYGGRLPDEIMKPSQGDSTHEADTFVMSGYDTEYLFSDLTEEAEQRLYQETLKYKEKLAGNKGTVTTSLFSDWSLEHCISEESTYPLSAGQQVTIDNQALFPSPQTMRVIGFELNLDIPCDTPVYTIGESPTYSRIGELESKIDSISLNGSSYMAGMAGTGAGSGKTIQLIKVGDSAKPTDKNAYSAARTDKEIAEAIEEAKEDIDELYISKKKDDRAAGKVAFDGGVETGNYQSGSSGAKLDGDGGAEVGSLLVRGDYLTDNFVSGMLGGGLALLKRNAAGRSYIEADEIYIRMKAYFDSLEIKHVYHTGGTNVLSPAGMTCSSVVEMTGGTLFDADGDIVLDADGEAVSDASDDGEVTAYRCYFKADDGEKAVVNEFRVGDLATCREFNIKEGVYAGVSNQYYWRKVTALGDDWIELSNEAGGYAEGSTAPKAGDDIVTLGNDSDETRQNAIVLGAFGEGSPYFVQYSGIDRFELTEDMVVTRLSPSGNRITGDLVVQSSGKSVETLIGSLGDDIAGFRTETSTKFEAQEREISSKVSETTFKENNEAVSERFSSITQRVDGIESTVQGVDGQVSEISQRVDGISLKVGTLWPDNLFPDGDFRHGTLATVEAGNIGYVKGADIADYPFSTTAKALHLVTKAGISLVLLGRGQIPAEPGRTYTAMFRCYCNQGDFTTSRCVGISFLNADGGTVYNYNPENVSLGSWRQVVMKATAPEGTRGIAGRVGTDGQSGKQLYVTDFMVFEGDLEGNPPEYFVPGSEDGLLATGIDIREKSIRLTSDNVSIRNNSGEETARLDEDGTFTANAIQASFKRVNLDSGVRGIIFKNAFSCVIHPTHVGPYVFLPNDAGLSGRVLRIAYGWPGGSGGPIFLLHSVKECKFYMSGRSYATAATENFAIRMIVGCVVSMIAVPSGESDDSPVNWHVLTEADGTSPGFSINTDVNEELWQEYWDTMTEDKYITI